MEASDMNVKQQVQEFYNQVGWQQLSDGFYQNAMYEDLRPVAHEYIHRCHLRVLRHLKPAGGLLLDAGSGPIQYPEYLEYSSQYQRRVCVDISILALQEARKRVGNHGLFVVADIANLPFKPGSFDGAVSLHTVHHLPADEHAQAYRELVRVLAAGSSAVLVNGWTDPPLMRLFAGPMKFVRWLRSGSTAQGRMKSMEEAEKAAESSKGGALSGALSGARSGARSVEKKRQLVGAPGTFVSKNNAAWLRREVGEHLPQGAALEIWCWRSLSVAFLRTFIHDRLAGRLLLRLIFWFEERFPHFLGERGQYPLIVVKTGEPRNTRNTRRASGARSGA